MSGARDPGGGGIVVQDGAGGAHARVEVCFELRGDGRPQVAAAAAELIDRLQELANRSDCECDLDVSMGWRAGAAGLMAEASKETAPDAATGR